jgi:hypothetical protein
MTVLQLTAGVIAMLGGAWLIGWWAVGLVLILFGVLIILDAVLKEEPEPKMKRKYHDDVLERWRRAR